MMGKHPVDKKVEEDIKTIIENSECGRKCILYPICLNKKHIVCDKLYRLYTQGYIYFDYCYYKTFYKLRTLFPNLKTFSMKNESKYLIINTRYYSLP
jgi:hypothetical protein